MKMDYKMIGKFFYKEKNNIYVPLKIYVLYKNDINSCAVLKFRNCWDYKVKKLEIEVLQYDEDDNLINTSNYVFERLNVKVGKYFVPYGKISLDDNCNKFIVNIISVNNSKYEEGKYLKYNIIVYDDDSYVSKIKIKNKTKCRRLSRLFYIITLILFTLGLILSIIYL